MARPHGLKISSFSLILLISIILCACSKNTLLKSAVHSNPPENAYQKDAMGMARAYRLGPGDRLDVIVEGIKDHSGKFDVNGSGYISMPVIGNIKAAGLTLPEFKRSLINALMKYVRNPRVRVSVLNFRPFYIQGEIRKGGQYAYQEGLDVRRAIAIAGGYTYRAVRSYIYIQRANDTKERKVSLKRPVIIQPGDNIRVPERFF